MDVRRNQEDPREQADPDRQDQRVDQCGSIGLRVAPPDEHEQAGHEHGIDRQVETVAGGREADVRPEQQPIAVRVDVAAEEEELARREQPPRCARAWLVHSDPDDDCDHAGETEDVDQRSVALERGDEHVQRRQRGSDGEVPDPDGAAKDRGDHAARLLLRAGCRSKLLVRRERTSSRFSISASVFAAVTWIRNPTSSLGTSG